MPLILGMFFLVVFISCTSNEKSPNAEAPQTPYGRADHVVSYLQQIDPYIKGVVDLQKQIDATAGSSGRATGRNLAEIVGQVRPQLQGMVANFDTIAPPPLLDTFHQEVRTLLKTRLAAYDQIIEGRKQEQASGEMGLYQKAETLLSEANDQIQVLNTQLQNVHQALREVLPEVQTASP